MGIHLVVNPGFIPVPERQQPGIERVKPAKRSAQGTRGPFDDLRDNS
jgi:hypothetical protein